jgi:hypothetical protein
MNLNLKSFVILVHTLFFSFIGLSQNNAMTWVQNDSVKNQVFPRATFSDSSKAENKINDFLSNKFLKQPESFRDEFTEFNELAVDKSKYIGIAISFIHEFNTSPGLWGFTDHEYFDIKNGNYIDITMLIDSVQLISFINLANNKKKEFLASFKDSVKSNTDNETNRINEIIDITLADSIQSKDLLKNINESKAMTLNYELNLYSNYLTLTYFWEYGWGLGQLELPNIILSFSFKELQSYFSEYAIELLID